MARPLLMRTLAAAALLALCALAASGCAGRGRSATARVDPLRVSAVAEQGDAARRASTGLVLQGLEASAAGRVEGALAQYERALQVDPTNPYAYLAVARHELDAGSPERALRFLDRAEGLLGAPLAPGVEAHLLGLRGGALRATGRVEEGSALLERARRLAPGVWSDARLDARELR